MRLRFLLLAFMICMSASMASAQGPVDVSISEDFPDVNPCTGEVVVYTFTGTGRLIEHGQNSILVASGTVVTSDGFSGTFNRQLVFHGDQVTHLRFHDMEVSNTSGQRILFGVGMLHEVSLDGVPVVSFTHFSGLRCVGPPATKPGAASVQWGQVKRLYQ